MELWIYNGDIMISIILNIQGNKHWYIVSMFQHHVDNISSIDYTMVNRLQTIVNKIILFMF